MDYYLTAGGSFKLVWWHYIRSYPTKKVPKNLILEINSQGFENVKKKKKIFYTPLTVSKYMLAFLNNIKERRDVWSTT